MIIITDSYAQPDAPDPVLSDERVLELARRHAGSARAVTFVDESGGEARAYLCDDDLVLKTQRPQQVRPRTSLAKEAFVLDQIAARATLPIPRVLGYGREDDAEYLLMTRVPGMPLRSASLSGQARSAVLTELGATLRRVHDIDQSAMVASALLPGDGSVAGLHDRISAMFEHLIASLGDDKRWPAGISLQAIADQSLSGLPATTQPVTLHSNPGPEHCFVDPGSGAFTGLIDFGDAYRSHPALDVRSWASPDDSRLMLAGYRALGPLPPGFEHVWRVGVILGQLRLAARGRSEPDQVARAITEILS